MKDEIKEKFCSLEELKRTIDCYDGYPDNEEVYYFMGALRFAYDYITNLQVENKKFKNWINVLNKDNHNYKSRNEKAIKFIYKEIQNMPRNGCSIRMEKIKNILQGVN